MAKFRRPSITQYIKMLTGATLFFPTGDKASVARSSVRTTTSTPKIPLTNDTVRSGAAAPDLVIEDVQGTVYLTKATAGAYTLAAPAAADRGRLLIVSTTAAAHTVTQTTPGFDSGGTASDVATFGAAIGNCMEVVAYEGVWHVVSLRNVTLA